MHLLKDIITYVRRIIKSPSDSIITDNLIVDYINRFWITDVDARLQLFDLKTKYQFQTSPGVDQYNMPLYSVQSETQNVRNNPDIGMFPVYQGFLNPTYINGVQVHLETQKNIFFSNWPNIVQYLQVVAVGNGSAGPYKINLPILSNLPIPPNPPLQGLLRGHIDITGIIATGINQDPPLTPTFLYDSINNLATVPTANTFPAFYLTSIDATGANVVVSDSGQFLNTNVNYGLLMKPGSNPYGNLPLGDGINPNVYSITQNTINYFSGVVNVRFPTAIPKGNNINAQGFYFQTGLPRGILYNNNTLTLRSPPDKQYLVELDAYLTPAAFFNTALAIPFGYMAEYIARGAARKILSDTGDIEQFQFYEGLFREQELLVWKRSQRQWTNNRTETIYSHGMQHGHGNNYLGGNTL